MNKFFRRLPLQAKLLLIGLIPFCFLVYLTLEIYREKTEKLKLFNDYRTYIEESITINDLIASLQEERKFSFDYALIKQRRKELVLQRPRTDALMLKLIKSNDPAIAGFEKYTKLGELSSIRNKVDSASIDANAIMHYYSNTVFRMNTLNTLPPANTAYLKPVYNDLMAQKILSEMITYLGIINSNFYNVLHTRKYMVETLMGTLGTYDVYKSYDAELMAKGSPEVLEQYATVKNNTAFKPTIAYVDAVFKNFAFDDSFNAAEWSAVSDEGTGELRKFQKSIHDRLNTKISELYAAEKQSRDKTLIFLTVALAAIISVVAYIVHIISLSLRKLRRAAEKIANGETGVVVRAESTDAIGSLARSISKIDKNNHTLAIAASAIGKHDFTVEVIPRGKNDALGNAVADMKNDLKQYREKMEILVAERTEELARSNEDLQQFAYVASHDLKEPLRKISLFSNILDSEHSSALPEKGKVYLHKIRHASQRMASMIEGVLAYSTVTVNEPPIEKVNLNHIMEGVLGDLELAIIQKDADIHYKNLPVVNGIKLQLHQLLYNLVNNALKFSKKDVPPVITIKSESITKEVGKGQRETPAKFVHITIADNGIGFNPEYAGRMFGVFFRLNAKDDYEGTGLGLALCRKIAERHGGEIYAEGKQGEGAVFHILLPVNPHS